MSFMKNLLMTKSRVKSTQLSVITSLLVLAFQTRLAYLVRARRVKIPQPSKCLLANCSLWCASLVYRVWLRHHNSTAVTASCYLQATADSRNHAPLQLIQSTGRVGLRVVLNHSLTQSLAVSLDKMTVVTISLTIGKLCEKQHWWISLRFPSAGAMSSVDNWRALQSAVRKCSLQ